jgi:hypothetical protein
MCRFGSIVRSIALSMIVLCAGVACAPDDEPPAPLPPAPAPAPPEGTDFSKTGSHGRVGVDPPDQTKPDKDVPISESDNAGGILGGSQAEKTYWDQLHPFTTCPKDPIYVYASSSEKSVVQCADGKGYAGLCTSCEKEAYQRAVNVVRSCERAPSCHGAIAQVGQQWSCSDVRSYLGKDANGNPIYGNTWWEKSCWTQYKVQCVSL